MDQSDNTRDLKARQAVLVWGVFIVISILLNGTIPYLLGSDVRGWVYSPTSLFLHGLLIYSGLFLVVPLILTKGWQTVSQPGFILPLVIAIVAIALWDLYRGISAIAVVVILYLHWRYDLSDLGIRWRGSAANIVAILLLAGLGLVRVFLRSGPLTFAPEAALPAGLDRLFANPASTVENLFYFGFLAERLSFKTGRWLTPLLVGAMYTIHEMTNPEYWYEGMAFALVFVGVVIYTIVYLWRRSVVVIWLGDGLGRFLSALFA